MSYQILTDSCCDFTREEYQTRRIPWAPLTLTLDGESQDNFTEPGQIAEFYLRLSQGAAVSTAAVNPEGWKACMEPVLAGGQDALVLCFSSGLSATYQSAVIAAQELETSYPQRRIHVCDTRCAALGQGFLVYHAWKKQGEGMDFASLCAWAEENKQRVGHWFTVEDLNHLRRGGRISPTAAILGTMLNVKPILHMDGDGRLKNMAKVRGRKAALSYLARKAADTAQSRELVFLAHGGCQEEAALLEAMLRQQGFQEVRTGCVGPVIGAHTGPGVLAVFFWARER